MRALVGTLLIGFFPFALANGCSSPRTEDPDSETNWLAPCASDDDCTGATRCLCGACTISCDREGACSGVPSGSVCTAFADSVGCREVSGSRCVAGSSTAAPDASDASVTNPTGDCAPLGGGARLGGVPESPTDTWFPDCKNPLSREYYRVFERRSGTAYIVPDPTAAPQYFVPACSDVQHSLHAIVMRYSFCDVSTPATKDLIRHMTPEDALAVTHYYHQQLLFQCGVSPAPFVEDMVDACALGTKDDAPELAGICTDARASISSPPADAGLDTTYYEGQAGCDLAYHLNQLYGIAAKRTVIPIAPELCGLPADAAACSATETRYFYDPVTTDCVSRPFGTCGPDVRDFATAEDCTAACIGRAQLCSHCDPISQSCVDASDCSVCPVARPSSGSACSDVGLLCDYDGTCGTACTCVVGDGGTPVWSCLTRLC